jgi:hypothetical protein
MKRIAVILLVALAMGVSSGAYAAGSGAVAKKKLMNAEFKNMPFAQAMEILFKQSGSSYSIMCPTAPRWRGCSVTADIKGLDLESSVAMCCRSAWVYYSKRGNVYTFGAQENWDAMYNASAPSSAGMVRRVRVTATALVSLRKAGGKPKWYTFTTESLGAEGSTMALEIEGTDAALAKSLKTGLQGFRLSIIATPTVAAGGNVKQVAPVVLAGTGYICSYSPVGIRQWFDVAASIPANGREKIGSGHAEVTGYALAYTIVARAKIEKGLVPASQEAGKGYGWYGRGGYGANYAAPRQPDIPAENGS